MLKSTLFIAFFFLATDISHAAGILMRIQQMKRMRQQQQQGMTQEQYQAYQEQQQGNQAQGQQPPAQPSYQQTVDQRNQAIAQAILSAHNQSVSEVNVPFGNNPDIGQTQQAPASPAATTPERPAVNTNSNQVMDVVDLSQVWKKLDTKSTVWALLIDDQAKVLTVSEYIDRFRQEGVKINLPPEHYVQMIDQISGQNPQLLDKPFGELLQILAIVDYDFDNGIDKDALAKKVLGETAYEANKKRFMQAQQPGAAN